MTVIPSETKLAAKRGFVRTTAQAYATALATGISATTILAIVAGEEALVPVIITFAVTAVSPLLAGAASYLSIISKGMPAEYVNAVVEQVVATGEIVAQDVATGTITAQSIASGAITIDRIEDGTP